MNRRSLRGLSALALLAFALWGPALSALLERVAPGASPLTVHLVNKGVFAGALLLVLARWDGLSNHGFRRGRTWWFLVPAAPLLLLTALVMLSPESPYGLGPAAVLGWVLVSIFVGIGEEGLFRGLVWRALEDRGLLGTSLLTSALFGAAHLLGLFSSIPWQLVASQAVFAAGVGMLFAAVRLVSGSLLVPIFLHALFDAGALVAAGGVHEMFSDTLSVARLLAPGIVLYAWGLTCVLVIRRRRRTPRGMWPARQRCEAT